MLQEFQVHWERSLCFHEHLIRRLECSKNDFSNKAINNGSACSVLFLNTSGLFPARRKTFEHLNAGNNPGVL